MQMYAQSTHLHNVYHVNVSPKNKYTIMYIVHICTVHVNISFLNKNHLGNSLYKLRAITGSSDGGTTSSTTLGAKRSDKDWEGLWVFRSSWIEKTKLLQNRFHTESRYSDNTAKSCEEVQTSDFQECSFLEMRSSVVFANWELSSWVSQPCEYMQTQRSYPYKQLIL